MKKLFVLVFLSLLLVPGCGKKKVEQKKPKVVTEVDQNERVKNSTHSDEAEEFVLEDDEKGNITDKSGANIFEEEKQTKKTNVEDSNDQDVSWAELDVDDNAKNSDVVQFDFNKSDIKPSEEVKIAKNAKMINEKLATDKKARVVVEGHSCKIAKNKEYNYALSHERAVRVKRAYKKHGVPVDKMKAVGMGTAKLITDKDGMQEQGVNRRAETVFLK